MKTIENFVNLLETMAHVASNAAVAINSLKSYYQQMQDEKNAEITSLKTLISNREWTIDQLNRKINDLTTAPATFTHTDIPNNIEYPIGITLNTCECKELDESGSGSCRKEHTKRKYTLKKQRKPKVKKQIEVEQTATGECLLCGEPTKKPNHKFCSVSHQVKYGHQQRGHATKPVEELKDALPENTTESKN